MRAIYQLFLWVVAASAFFLVSGTIFGVSAQENNFSAKEPALMTAAGQSADLNMAKVIFERCKVALKTVPLAGPDDLKDMNSLVIVIGGSTKGLGAAGINTEKEMTRIEQLLAAAAARKIPIIGMHIGGKARRGELSDKFIDLVVPRVSFLMLLKEGDSDGYFSKMIASQKIGARMTEKLVELQEPIKTIYSK
jgi:hypothetical protein